MITITMMSRMFYSRWSSASS